MQDFTKDMVLVFAGTGTTTEKNLDLLLDYIFGDPELEVERDVTILIPAQYEDAPGVRTMRRWGTPMGMEFSIVSGEPHDSLDKSFDLLAASHKKGEETAFIMFYNPKSKYEKDDPSLTDLEVIGEAKNHKWLTTFNLSEGLVDFFDGYESTEDRLHREEAQAAYDAELKAKEEAEKPARAPRKTAAKKATTPRKRATSKPTEVVDVPLPVEPEKPLAAPLCACGGQTLLQMHTPENCYDVTPVVAEKSGLDNLVAASVQREAERKAARELGELNAKMAQAESLELSGTIVLSTPKLPENLVPVETADVWSDVAKAAAAGEITHFSVPKADIVELGEAMEEMANAFGKAIRVYKNIVEGK